MTNFNLDIAMYAILKETDLTKAEISNTNVEINGSLAEISFEADNLYYDCYMNADSYEIEGINFEPYAAA